MSQQERARATSTPRNDTDHVLPTAPPLAHDRHFLRAADAIHEYALFTLDPAGTIASWNEGAERIKGWRAEEIVGQPFAALFSDADRRAGKPMAEVEHARRHGRFDGEGWRQRKDGSRFWAGVTLTALYDDDGEVVGFVKVTRDLSAKLRTEQLLRTRARMQESVNRLGIAALSGKPFEFLLQRASRAVALATDADFAIVMEHLPEDDDFVVRAGYGWERGFAADDKRVRGGRDSVAGYVMESGEPILIDDLQWETRFPPPSYLHDHDVRSGIAAPIQNGGPAYGVAAVYSRKPRAFSADEVNFVQSVANILQLALERDRHERELHAINEQLEQRVAGRTAELRRANEELEAFTYVVSHDLKEPVRAILAFLSTAKVDIEDRDLALRHLQQAERTTHHLGTLLEGLLEWSRLAIGAHDLQPVHLPDLARRPHCQVQWERLLAERSASVHVDEDIPPVLGTPAIVCQILGNVVVNAIKHNPRPDPRVEVLYLGTTPDGCIDVAVDDSGLGFPETVVERFERMRAGQPKTIRGGFGLALTARAIEKLGGSMHLESSGSGSGRVRLRFRAPPSGEGVGAGSS